MQVVDAFLMELLETTFGDQKAALPIISAIKHHQALASVESYGGFRIVRLPRHAHPEHVHRGSELIGLQAGAVTNQGMPAIRADHQVGANLERAFGRHDLNAGHPPAIFDEAGDLGLHLQVEGGKAARLFGDEIQKVPLRHQRDKTALSGQMREIPQHYFHAANMCCEPPDLLMRPLQQLVQDAEFVHQFEGRGMDGVAPEIAQEVAMLFKDDDLDSGARQQIAEHHPRWTAARNAAPVLGHVFSICPVLV